MKRVRGAKKSKIERSPVINADVQLDQHSLLSRSALAAWLGYSHDGDRNIYDALGYDISVSYSRYVAQYQRQDIAKAVINRPIDMTWQGDLTIAEGSKKDETELEKGFVGMSNRLMLKSKFKRLDKLSSIGYYGVLLLGFSDVKTPQDLEKPIQNSPDEEESGNVSRDLIYVKPYGEGSVDIDEYETNPTNPRYGMPKVYKINMSIPGGARMQRETRVHWTRVIHVTGELMESEVEGTPELEPIWNRLKDLEKVTGGSAEMFWLGARPGYHFSVKDGANLNQADFDDLKTQMDEYEHNIRRILRTKGIDIDPMAPQVQDPSNTFETAISAISAVKGIPKRILLGSERGELSSGQDRTEWLEKIQSRRDEYAEQQIVRPFIDRCIMAGALPAATEEDDYEVQWQDLFAPSDKEKAEIGKVRAEALKAYGSVPGLQDIMPVESFVELFLGLPREEVEKITERIDEMALEEQRQRPSPEEEEVIRREEQMRRVPQNGS